MSPWLVVPATVVVTWAYVRARRQGEQRPVLAFGIALAWVAVLASL